MLYISTSKYLIDTSVKNSQRNCKFDNVPPKFLSPRQWYFQSQTKIVSLLIHCTSQPLQSVSFTRKITFKSAVFILIYQDHSISILFFSVFISESSSFCMHTFGFQDTSLDSKNLCKSSPFVLGYPLAWACENPVHAVKITVNLYVHLTCYVQKTLFSFSHPLPLAHIIFPFPFKDDFWVLA